MSVDRTGLAKCDACGAPILFARLASGKRVPLDARRGRVYRVTIEGGEARAVQIGREGFERVVSGDPEAATALVSHFVTCSDPGRFSGGSRKP